MQTCDPVRDQIHETDTDQNVKTRFELSTHKDHCIIQNYNVIYWFVSLIDFFELSVQVKGRTNLNYNWWAYT